MCFLVLSLFFEANDCTLTPPPPSTASVPVGPAYMGCPILPGRECPRCHVPSGTQDEH